MSVNKLCTSLNTNQCMKEVIWIILIINENPGTSVSKQSYIFYICINNQALTPLIGQLNNHIIKLFA